ncbi:SRPBCC family protein [Pelobium manganitolerans]|uniref:SRPBCC family protein n=1 Tax=Pelobium manganitolerans TaxID=1842495 RepID=UPI003FA3870F
MRVYHLNCQQVLPISLNEAWDFFSSPLNLARITPRSMNFTVTSDFSDSTKMYEGMIITYKVSPLFGIKLNWMTEITTVCDKQYFIDEQRFGPFKFWHHEHHFKETKDGVLMRDELTYGMPFGVLGTAVNALVVGKQVRDIFTYREQAVTKLFGKP